MLRYALATILATLLPAALGADVRITSTTTLEGGMAAAIGGVTPRLTMQVKGSKSRADVDLGDQTLTSITDLDARQFTLLNSAQKTAQVLTPDSKPAPDAVPLNLPEIGSLLKPTGRSRTITGASCEEFTLAMTMSMADVVAAGQMPPQTSEMLRGIKLAVNGSMWLATAGPGIQEFTAFQAAAEKTGMSKLMSAIFGTGSGALDRLLNVFATSAGVPYLTELTVTIGGDDKLAQVLMAQGPMKVTTQVTEVSTAAIADDTFVVPAGYETIK